MNRRQWKKQYKKKHGCNPPTIKDTKKVMNVFKGAINAVIESITEITKKLPDILDGVKDAISKMSDDEFLEFLSKIDNPGTKAMALKMRRAGGNKVEALRRHYKD